MTIDEIEAEIQSIYHWFTTEAPGVTPQEEGHLATLWALADRHYLADALDMTEDDVIAEYGHMTLLERDIHG